LVRVTFKGLEIKKDRNKEIRDYGGISYGWVEVVGVGKVVALGQRIGYFSIEIQYCKLHRIDVLQNSVFIYVIMSTYYKSCI
jgi:hypothetical protein